MAESLEKIRQVRIEKLKKIKEMGIDPYPPRVSLGERANVSEVREQKEGTEVVTSGRLFSWREHGKLIFADIRDSTGKLQLLFKLSDEIYYSSSEAAESGEVEKSDSEDGSQIEFTLQRARTIMERGLLDIGDFIAVKGPLFTTKKGELTIEVKEFELLSKSLRPIPSEHFGVEDTETRYRQRYLDLLSNPEVKERFEKRTTITREIRKYLDSLGYQEVETPTLQLLYGGTNAKPFKTHLNALDQDYYLRIADELYLKRLVVGGYDKVYEICKDFRNEGMSLTHNPEFTMIEYYTAYADYHKVMEVTEGLFKHVAKVLYGKPTVHVGENTVSLQGTWPKVTMLESFKKYLDWDIENMSNEELDAKIKQSGMDQEALYDRGHKIFALFDHLVTPKLIDPVWIIDYPREVSPLSRQKPSNPEVVERFEGYIGGKEIADGWTEIVDPLEQRARFEGEQQRMKKGDTEAHPVDEDFLTALEYGIPPLGGIGIGIDRLTMFFTNTWNIKEVILFPTMRPVLN